MDSAEPTNTRRAYIALNRIVYIVAKKYNIWFQTYRSRSIQSSQVLFCHAATLLDVYSTLRKVSNLNVFFPTFLIFGNLFLF